MLNRVHRNVIISLKSSIPEANLYRRLLLPIYLLRFQPLW